NRPPRILVPLDGSGQSTAILALVARLRARLCADVELLHVLVATPPVGVPAFPPLPPDSSPADTAARAYLERVATRLPGLSPAAECVVRRGRAADVITAQIGDGGADLVAMTTHGRNGLARLLVGSVAEQVLRTAEIPVLLWKAPIPPTGARTGRSPEST